MIPGEPGQPARLGADFGLVLRNSVGVLVREFQGPLDGRTLTPNTESQPFSRARDVHQLPFDMPFGGTRLLGIDETEER